MNLYPDFKSKIPPKVTSKPIQSLLPHFLDQVNRNCDQRYDLIPLAWPEIVGEKLAPMTRAGVFKDGVLEVKVTNSTLLSILNHTEKKILLKKLKEKFPKTDIREIRFRLS